MSSAELDDVWDEYYNNPVNNYFTTTALTEGVITLVIG
jgi:hypothetical protein